METKVVVGVDVSKDSLDVAIGPQKDIIDGIIVRDGSNDDRFLCTTSHPDERFEDVLVLVQAWDGDAAGEIHEVHL